MNYQEIEKKIGYEFKNKKLLDLAFVHKSIDHTENYERLEFLGDAIIGAIVTEVLYFNFKNLNEGELSKYRAAIVRLDALYDIAEKLKISDYILKEQDNCAGNKNIKNKRIISNVYEAVIGAVFIDSSYEKTKEILLSHLNKFNPAFYRKKPVTIDFKSTLQELVQKESGSTPQYITVKKEGPAHNAFFTICVKINGKIFGYGTGSSKKIAEQNGAKKVLKKYLEQTNDKK